MAIGATDQTATADAPAAPVGRGGWVYLPEDLARQHPLYGVYGWALLLFAYLFIWPPILQVWQDARILFFDLPRRPQEFWLVFAADLVFMVACWIAGAKLARENPQFPRVFYLAMLIGLCAGVLFYAVLVEGMPREYETMALLGMLRRVLPVILLTIYVARSRRINVTIRKRVTGRDPFLRAQWMTEAAPGLRPPHGRRQGVFARPFRKVAVEPRSTTPMPVPTVLEDVASPQPAPSGEPLPEEMRAAEPSAPTRHPVPAATAAARRPLPPRAGAVYVPRPRASVPERAAAAAAVASARLAPRDPQRARRVEHTLLLDRLRRLQIAHDEGLITDEELRGKRAELLREF